MKTYNLMIYKELVSLWKTDLTYLAMTMKEDIGFLSSHTSKEVLKRHYVNENVVLKAIRDVEIFNKCTLKSTGLQYKSLIKWLIECVRIKKQYSAIENKTV